MGGLSSILDSITREAKYTADKFMAEVYEEKKVIAEQLEADKAALTDEMAKKLQDDCMNLSRRIEGQAEAEARQIILSAKKSAIDSITEQLKRELKNTESRGYFSFLEKLALKNREDGEGVMYLSKADLARMPADFEERINKGLSEGKITIAKDALDIDGGFIIRYGRVDINCTIESIFEEKQHRIADIINESLFEG